jgi:hypothetical protein
VCVLGVRATCAQRHFDRKPLPFYERWFFVDDLTIGDLEGGGRMGPNRTDASYYPQTIAYARN